MPSARATRFRRCRSRSGDPGPAFTQTETPANRPALVGIVGRRALSARHPVAVGIDAIAFGIDPIAVLVGAVHRRRLAHAIAVGTDPIAVLVGAVCRRRLVGALAIATGVDL